MDVIYTNNLDQVETLYREHAKRKNLLDRTVEQVLLCWKGFSDYLKKIYPILPPLEEIALTVLDAYFEGKNYSPYTVRTITISVRMLLKLYHEAGFSKSFPLLCSAVTPKCPAVRRDVLTEEELKKIWESLYTKKEFPCRRSYLLAIDRVVFNVCLLGMRLSEMAAIRWGDVASWKSFTVRVKGGRNRTFPISQDLWNALDHLTIFVTPVDVAFVFSRNASDTETNRKIRITTSVRRMLKRAGIEREGYSTTHLFRHSMATILYMKSRDIRRVSQYLGHASTATTEKYIHCPTEDHLFSLNTISTAINPDPEIIGMPPPPNPAAAAKTNRKLRNLIRGMSKEINKIGDEEDE